MRNVLKEFHRSPRLIRRGYSLLEVLITVLIIQIISGMIMVNVSNVQTDERLNRAAEQIIAATRYARILSMSTGRRSEVQFDTSANTFSVLLQTLDANGNPVWTDAPTNTVPTCAVVTDTMISGGTYTVNLTNERELSGVTISGTANLSAANPYYVMYGNLGNPMNLSTTANPVLQNGSTDGSVTLTYGGEHKIIDIPVVGEASITAY